MGELIKKILSDDQARLEAHRRKEAEDYRRLRSVFDQAVALVRPEISSLQTFKFEKGFWGSRRKVPVNVELEVVETECRSDWGSPVSARTTIIIKPAEPNFNVPIQTSVSFKVEYNIDLLVWTIRGDGFWGGDLPEKNPAETIARGFLETLLKTENVQIVGGR